MSRDLDTFIRGVDHPADLLGEGQERDYVLPGVQPRLGDDREPLAPLLVESLKHLLGGVSVHGRVDRLQIAGDLLALLAGHVLQAMAQEVNDAGLHGGLGEDRLDRLGEALEPVHAADQDVLDAALLELGEHLHPELGALGVLEPHPEHVTLALDGDPQRQVAGLALHAAALADLQDHGVEEDHRVDVLQRPLGPGADVVHHGVGHLGDQVAADLHAVHLLQVRLDVARRQAPRVEREDLLVEPHEPPLALSDDLRLKAAVAIPGSVDRHLPLVGDQRLRCRAVARVLGPTRRLAVRLIAHVIGQLDLHRALHQPLGQLRQQASGPRDLRLGPGAGQQLVDHLIGNPLTIRPLQHPTQSRALHGVIHQLLAQTPRFPHLQGGRRRLAWGLAADAPQFRNPRSLE